MHLELVWRHLFHSQHFVSFGQRVSDGREFGEDLVRDGVSLESLVRVLRPVEEQQLHVKREQVQVQRVRMQEQIHALVRRVVKRAFEEVIYQHVHAVEMRTRALVRLAGDVFGPKRVHDGGGEIMDRDRSFDGALALLPIWVVAEEATPPRAVQITQEPILVSHHIGGPENDGLWEFLFDGQLSGVLAPQEIGSVE